MGVKKIRVIETRTVEYTPDWNDNAYSQLPEKTLEAAIELDKKDYEAGELILDDLETVYDATSTRTVTWEIVEVD